MSDQGDYCAFTKAVEHLGDRWSLVIVRELQLRGTLGFNALADGCPGSADPSSRRGCGTSRCSGS